MSSVDKELALTTIVSMMKENDISVSEIPEYSSSVSNMKTYIEELSAGFKQLYSKLCDCISEESAYDWAVNDIGTYVLSNLDIFPPKLFKVVDVRITTKLAVPYTWEDYSIEELALDYLYYECDFELEVEADRVDENRLNNYNYINNPEGFDGSDWQ